MDNNFLNCFCQLNKSLNLAAVKQSGMELIKSDQVSFDSLYNTDFDLVVVVSGYESRCPYLIEKIKLGGEKRIVLAFKEKSNELYRSINDKKYQEFGFQFIHESGNRHIEVNELLKNTPYPVKEELDVLVDYSCMTKIWYASFINYFIRTDMPYQKVKIHFAYTASLYTEPKKPRPFKIAEPLGYTSHRSASGKPLALVMGLGYEKDRAEILHKTLNPDETYVFYSDPADDYRFVEKVYINNFKLIDKLQKTKVINYPVRDLKKIDSLLTTLCLDLRFDYRVILAPLGPKPFTLCCILLAARYPDIEVWRVSAGESESVYDRQPCGEPLVYKVEFGLDEEYAE